MNTQSENLEKMIDQFGLEYVIGQLVDVCHEKADHVRSNWQDEKLAKVWDRNAKVLYICQSKVKSV